MLSPRGEEEEEEEGFSMDYGDRQRMRRRVNRRPSAGDLARDLSTSLAIAPSLRHIRREAVGDDEEVEREEEEEEEEADMAHPHWLISEQR